MKSSAWCVLALVAGALVMQGCAQTGDVKTQAPAASAPAPVAAAAPAAAAPAAVPQSSVEIPVNGEGKPVVKADTKENFDAIVAAIHQQMQPGGRWQYIDADERATIDGNFADMDKLYAQFGSVDKMDRDATARLIVDQNSINTILTNKDGNRLVCTQEIRVGTHFPVKTCRTYAEIQSEQRGAQEQLRKLSNSTQLQHSH